jgi:serine/threonine-protein kinase
VDARQAGRELNVSAIVEGSVRREGDRWTLAVEVVNTDDGFQLWSRTYRPAADELPAMQSEVANDVARVLKLPLGKETARAGKRTNSGQAFNLVLRARYLDPTSMDTAAARIGHFRKAAELDPDFPDAWIGVADSLMRMAGLGAVAPYTVIDDARAAVNRARALDERLPDVHFLTAMLTWRYDWNWDAAEPEFRRALALDANSAPFRTFYALYLAHMGRTNEAMQQLESVRVLEPVLGIQSVEASVHYYSRDYDRTIRFCRDGLREEPSMAPLYYWMGRAYASKAMRNEAISALEKAAELQGPIHGRGFGMLGRLYAEAGRREDAQRLLANIMTKANDRWVSPLSIAAVHIGLGDHDRAMDWIEKGYRERDLAIATLKVEPAYDVLRENARFQALIGRLKL